jgi:hypothetical protein
LPGYFFINARHELLVYSYERVLHVRSPMLRRVTHRRPAQERTQGRILKLFVNA